MTQSHILCGHVLAFTDTPFGQSAAQDACNVHEAIAFEGGTIHAVGRIADLRAALPEAQVHDCSDRLILPGFVDAHVHYPQTTIIASWGKRLIDRLNTYTFPEEMRFGEPACAAEISERYLDLALTHGTTAMASYCTIHTASVDALFSAAEARGMAVVAGKTCMDRNAPEGLRDTAQSAYDDSKALLERWHGRGRALCDHTALLPDLHTGAIGSPGGAVGRTPGLSDANPSQ